MSSLNNPWFLQAI